MANGWYNRAALRVANGSLNLSTATLKAMLVTASYTYNPDHDFVNSGPAAAELSGTGYASGFAGAGRKTITGKVFTEDDANDRAEMDADDLTWTTINAGSPAAMVVYESVTTDADSGLVAFFDSGFPKTTNGGDLVVTVNAEGLLQFSTV